MRPDQVAVLKADDLNIGNDDSVLRVANPKDRQFRSLDDWRRRGIRVVIMSQAFQTGADGMQFIEDLIVWSPPSGLLKQLCGRFVRPADRYKCTSTAPSLQTAE